MIIVWYNSLSFESRFFMRGLDSTTKILARQKIVIGYSPRDIKTLLWNNIVRTFIGLLCISNVIMHHTLTCVQHCKYFISLQCKFTLLVHCKLRIFRNIFVRQIFLKDLNFSSFFRVSFFPFSFFLYVRYRPSP